MGSEMEPSGFTTRSVPPFSVTRKDPSGKNASDHGALRLPVMTCAWNGADVGGTGAFVCPGNAGLDSGDCAIKVPSAAVIRTTIAKVDVAFVECERYIAIWSP